MVVPHGEDRLAGQRNRKGYLDDLANGTTTGWSRMQGVAAGRMGPRVGRSVLRRDVARMVLVLIGIMLAQGLPSAASGASPGPSLLLPTDGAWLNTSRPALAWSSGAAGPDAQAAAQVQIAATPAFTQVVLDRIVAGNATSWTATTLGDGHYSWRVRTQDSGGNWSEWSGHGNFHVDTDGPYFKAHWYGDGTFYTNVNPVSLQINATDVAAPALVEGSWRIDNRTWSPYVPIGAPVKITLPPGDGEKLFEVRLRDPAGNDGEEQAASIVLDTVAPQLNPLSERRWMTDPNTGTAVIEVSMVDDDDSHSMMSGREEGGNWSAWEEWNWTIDVAVRPGIGPRTVEVRARDRVGNVGQPQNLTFAMGAVDFRGTSLEWGGSEGRTLVELTGTVNAVCVDTVEGRLNDGRWYPATINEETWEQPIGEDIALRGVSWSIRFGASQIPSGPLTAEVRAACGTTWITSGTQVVDDEGMDSFGPSGPRFGLPGFIVVAAIILVATGGLMYFLLRRPKEKGPAASGPASVGAPATAHPSSGPGADPGTTPELATSGSGPPPTPTSVPTAPPPPTP